jgi:hypothetical protein
MYAFNPSNFVGRYSAVRIATYYELDFAGIERREGKDIPHPTTPAQRQHNLLHKVCRVSFPGVKRPTLGLDHPPSSTEVKQRELYLYSLSRTGVFYHELAKEIS